MRVLWLCSTPGLGGERLGVPATQGSGWEAALEGAAKRHSAVELSIAFPWDVPEVRQIQAGRHQYLPFPRFPRGGRLARLLVDVSCRLEPEVELGNLERVIEVSRPDLIHVFGTESPFGLIAERSDIPVLVEIKGLRTQCAEAYLAEFSKLDLLRYGSPKRLLNGRSQLHQYHRYRKTALREKRILETARFVAGRTECDRLACAAMSPHAKYFRCEEVLRPPFYEARRHADRPGGPLRIVSTLRGNAYKGLATLARTAELLRSRLSGGFEWSLIGSRSNDEVPRIVRRKLGLDFASLGVRLLGRLDADEVASRLAASDVYVHPSRVDNSPNGLCEAMAAALPVVSTNVGGIPSLVTHGVEGLLVEPGDPVAATDAIVQIAGDEKLARRLASNAHQRAVARHDPASVISALDATYLQVLAE